jgi:hypothetical protein
LSPKPRSRKQHIVLRAKRKSELKQQFEMATLGVLVAVLLMGIVVSAVLRNDAWAPRFVHDHTPHLEFQAPDTLTDLPLLKETPTSSFMLWFPLSAWRLRHRWMEQYPALGGVHFERHYFGNRIVAQLEPRIPLVRWQDHGVDSKGTLFPLLSPKWATLPKAVFFETQALPVMAQWLGELSRYPQLWGQVVAVTEDQRGQMWLDMQTGTHVAWGTPDLGNVKEKAKCLVLVLEDAHRRLSGASTADLRFFEDGRVIVRPKSAA